jgi:hypothetical protein
MREPHLGTMEEMTVPQTTNSATENPDWHFSSYRPQSITMANPSLAASEKKRRMGPKSHL